MSDNPFDFLTAKRWKQIIALTLYGILQIVLSFSPDAKQYSWISPFVLVGLGVYIIKTQGSLCGAYSQGNMDGLKEFLDEKKIERDNTDDTEHGKFLIKVCDQIQSRITTFERMYSKYKQY
jgi:hypothetical protein